MLDSFEEQMVLHDDDSNDEFEDSPSVPENRNMGRIYTAYGSKKVYMMKISIGREEYEEIEIEYADADMKEIINVYHVVYGKNPSRRRIGSDVEWGWDPRLRAVTINPVNQKF